MTYNSIKVSLYLHRNSFRKVDCLTLNRKITLKKSAVKRCSFDFKLECKNINFNSEFVEDRFK